MATPDGFNQYLTGDIQTATVLIQQALRKGDYTVAAVYADIRLRNLDGKGQSCAEAAFWYIKAAMNGDGDVFAYLRTISFELISDDTTEEEKVKKLTNYFENKSST